MLFALFSLLVGRAYGADPGPHCSLAMLQLWSMPGLDSLRLKNNHLQTHIRLVRTRYANQQGIKESLAELAVRRSQPASSSNNSSNNSSSNSSSNNSKQQETRTKSGREWEYSLRRVKVDYSILLYQTNKQTNKQEAKQTESISKECCHSSHLFSSLRH
jgi:hypothetical protein